jgi:5-methyltetrahydrofolate--homocysteine methyltransferase
MNPIDAVYKSVVEGDAPAAKAAVEAALQAGLPAGQLMQEGLIAAMTEVGRRYEAGEFYVPEMLIAARAMQNGLAILKPLLIQSGIPASGRVAIGTVKGDLHDIGKNLVAMMLEGAGFDILDLGTDVAPEKFVAAVSQEHVDIISLSALLTTTMPAMASTIDALIAAGLRNQVKVMVGGAPVTEAYARQVGADGYGPDASSAVRLARELILK